MSRWYQRRHTLGFILGISLGFSDIFLFGSDEGIILSSAVDVMVGSTLGLDEGAYLGYSDGSLIVSMMSHLRVNCL